MRLRRVVLLILALAAGLAVGLAVGAVCARAAAPAAPAADARLRQAPPPPPPCAACAPCAAPPPPEPCPACPAAPPPPPPPPTPPPPPPPSAAPDGPTVLVLTIVNDGASYGGPRTVADHLALVQSLDFPREQLSVGMLASAPAEFERVSAALAALPVRRTQAVQLDISDARAVGRSDAARHAPQVQRERRSLLARYRNYLLSRALRDEDWVLWVDADIARVPATLLTSLLAPGRDIVTPLCRRGGHNYDLNAWQGARLTPSERELRALDAGGLFVPRPVPGRTRHMDQLRGQEDAEGCVPLDSVGGTVLLVRADVHRLVGGFPPMYAVGATWERQGWDGIETEGLCFVAKHSMGAQCWGMPGVEVEHHRS